ncbi:MAG: DNA/RNA non-specific endonuclease [Oscillospiraceae bacterium]|nr:DNA/RNA non-specific endonuclease [Oscillospiraceae bacterium]
MANDGSYSVDPRTGSKTFTGSSEITKGNHSGMPKRDSSYEKTDERGHIQMSALGGTNGRENIAPQSKDLNHGAYLSMERGERAALKDGATIQSEKTAYVSNQPGQRPDAFMVNDTVTYPDGQTQNIHLSFSNLTNEEQESMNQASLEQASDLFDSQPNPGDGLRDSMSPEEYSALMEETDAELPTVSQEYDEAVSLSYDDLMSESEPSAAMDGADNAQSEDGGMDM